MDHRRKKLIVNSVLQALRVTHFQLRMLEPQVATDLQKERNLGVLRQFLFCRSAPL